jgi:hypothetical protein
MQSRDGTRLHLKTDVILSLFVRYPRVLFIKQY